MQVDFFFWTERVNFLQSQYNVYEKIRSLFKENNIALKPVGQEINIYNYPSGGE